MPSSQTSLPNESKSPGALRCSVVMPVFRGGKHFAACLASVLAALREEDELIVVADGEGDGSWRAAQSSRARIIHCAGNRGPACARNQGASAATGDFLFFVDADVSVPPDCISKIAEIFASDPTLSAVIGSYDDAPGEQNFLSQFKNLFHHYVHQHGAAEASTFWGACGAIRRRTFLELGGLDENYSRSSIEDIELGYRLRENSHRIRLAHDLQVKHWKRWNAWSLWCSDLADRAAPWTELILRQRLSGNNPVPNDLNLGLRYQLSLLTSLLFSAALAMSVLWRGTLWLVPPLVMLFFFFNAPLFRFFQAKRGWKFCAAAAGWRFLYDLCSALGFCYGTLRFFSRNLFPSRPGAQEISSSRSVRPENAMPLATARSR